MQCRRQQMQLDGLKNIVGDNGWTSAADELQPHLTEWRGTWVGKTPLMLMPTSTDEVARLVGECARLKIGLVPQGGNTGLCGGAIPDDSGQQVLLSLQRMHRIRSLSADNFSMIAEAGCVLSDLQEAASKARRLFPLSLAAEGSCQIGGNLSTNAGGVNVLRYGTARDQVLGLEVVLPDGSVINALRELRKDTGGYDLKQLFIGSEGTLGIITAAALRLYPALPDRRTAMLAIDSPQQAVALLAFLREKTLDQLQAFELLSELTLQIVCTHISGTRRPFTEAAPWYVLLDVALDPDYDNIEPALIQALERGFANDVVIAKNDSEQAALWRIRHSVSEAQKFEGASLKHDVSVPIDCIARFIEAATVAVETHWPGSRVVAFGHVGDGNVHFNVSQPPDWPAPRFLAERARLAARVHDIVASLGGSFSAEHGVGVLKKGVLAEFRAGAEIKLMRALKSLLDPDNIMNPGKVL
ncbi:MAG: FAD-binding oxidoreductase [Woeseia sp.]|nr:FAD-binding oxidoreductase [Woeseia sp.]NNL53537.1 FAD-binding oxidoreductase [Woeseia sp.]